MSKKDLYFISFQEFISRDNEIQKLDKEVQKFKYNKYEENRLKLIEEVRKLRKELKSKKKDHLVKSNSASYILSHGNNILKNEKIRYQHLENQQIGFMLNLIDREYKRDELEKKLELQNKLAFAREMEIKKIREKEKIEHDERDRIQALKMKERSIRIKKEMLKKAKALKEEDKKLMEKNEMRRLAEERERKERQRAIKMKEQIFRKRIEYLYTLKLKRQQNIERQFLEKEELQRKNMEELKIRKDKEIKERIRTAERRKQRALNIIKIKNKERDLKNQKYYNKKNELIKKQLSLQAEQSKLLMRERLIQTAIRREEVEENLKRKEELLKRNRLKLLFKINEKDEMINMAKIQQLKIWDEQKKISKNFERSREKLLSKFKELMGKRRKKSKEKIISELMTNKSVEFRSFNLSLLNNSQITDRSINTVKRNKPINNIKKSSNNDIFLTNLSFMKHKSNNIDNKKINDS